MSTEWILNAAQAYSSRQHKGNLCDILQVINTATKYSNPLSPMTQIVEMGPKLARHKDLIHATQASAALPPHLKLLEGESFRSLLQAQPPKTYIANQALDGFIESFRWSYPSFNVMNFMLRKPQQQPQCITERGLIEFGFYGSD